MAAHTKTRAAAKLPSQSNASSTLAHAKPRRPPARHRPSDGAAERRACLSRWFFWTVFVIGGACFLLGFYFQGYTSSILLKDDAERGVFAREGLSRRELFEESKAGRKDSALARKLRNARNSASDFRVAGTSTFSWLINSKVPLRPARLALVSRDLTRSPENVYLLTVATGLKSLGYSIEILSHKGGSMREFLGSSGFSVKVLDSHNASSVPTVDWLRYEGVMVNSLQAKHFITGLLKEPFSEVPLIWVLHEDYLAKTSSQYDRHLMKGLLAHWRKVLSRADAVVFPSTALMEQHRHLDTGNFFVVPGTPATTWSASAFSMKHAYSQERAALNIPRDDFVVAVVSREAAYRGMWREKAMVLQAAEGMQRMRTERTKAGKGAEEKERRLWAVMVASDEGAEACAVALKALVEHMKLTHVSTTCVPGNSSSAVDSAMLAADAVVYSSVKEDDEFPAVLIRAMVLRRVLIVPSLLSIKNEITHGVNAIVFSPGDAQSLQKALHCAYSLSPKEAFAMSAAGHHAALSIGAHRVALDVVEMFERLTELGLDVRPPSSSERMRRRDAGSWVWGLREQQGGGSLGLGGKTRGRTGDEEGGVFAEILIRNEEDERVLEELGRWETVVGQAERAWMEGKGRNLARNETRSLMLMEEMDVWEEVAEEMRLRELQAKEDLEDEELSYRRETDKRTWDEVKVMVKRADRDVPHEREDGELERLGQVLSIYEPYLGKGSWPFLQTKRELYRGVSLSEDSRRPPEFDDVEAWARLPFLATPYYRDVLCEFGAFFAVGFQIDRIHRSNWIGFQPWRNRAANTSLSSEAESAILYEIETNRERDVIFFWVSTAERVGLGEVASGQGLSEGASRGMNGSSSDSRGGGRSDNGSSRSDGSSSSSSSSSNGSNSDHGSGRGSSSSKRRKVETDFWLHCNALNRGNCRSTFLEAMKIMYGLPSNWTEIPPMPSDSGLWSAAHSWIMPTPVFMEFVLFSRMFVDALDAKFFERHTAHGICPLGQSHNEEKHCYCRILEQLVNVWAYHSRRRMIYVNPSSGAMSEQHHLETRIGRSKRNWYPWFSKVILKAMDEDRAEETDDLERYHRRWLWPHTGEISWKGSQERERLLRGRQKIEKERKKKERLAKMRLKYKQKALGSYKPQKKIALNSTINATSILNM